MCKISAQYVKACRRKVWKTGGRRPGRTDRRRPDGHHHTIIRPVWRGAYKKRMTVPYWTLNLGVCIHVICLYNTGKRSESEKMTIIRWTQPLDPSPTHQTSTQDPTSDKSQGGGVVPDPPPPPPSGSALATGTQNYCRNKVYFLLMLYRPGPKSHLQGQGHSAHIPKIRVLVISPYC